MISRDQTEVPSDKVLTAEATQRTPGASASPLGSIASYLPWVFALGCLSFFVYDNFQVFPFMHNDLFQRGPFYGSSRGEGVWREMSKIFNICVGEAEGRMVEGGENLCIARGRPLSFLVDMLDAKALVALNGIFNFGPRSVSHYILVLLTVCFLYKTFRLFFPADASWGRSTSAALASFYAIAPEVLTMNGFYFRSAKELGGLFIAMMFYVFCRWRRNLLTSQQKAAWCLLLCVGALSDETGVAVAGLMVAVTAIDLTKTYSQRFGMMLVYGLPVLTYVVFQRWIDGALSLKLEGIRTTRAFASPSDFLSLDWALMQKALSALLFRLLIHLGNPEMQSGGVCAFILISLLLACALTGQRSEPSKDSPAILSWYQAIVLGGGIGLVYWVMAMRHPAIITHEIRNLGYYYVALLMVSLFIVAQLPLARRAYSTHASRTMVLAAMAAMAIGHATTASQMRMAYLLHGDSQQLFIAQRDSKLLTHWWESTPNVAGAGGYARPLVAYRDWLARTVRR